MEIRDITRDDAQGLVKLVTSVYADSPDAMNFESKPDEGKVIDLLNKKLHGLKGKELVDMVASEGGRVVADCEIARINGNEGIVGIIVANDYRRRSIGETLLGKCVDKAKAIGIKVLYAEVKNGNRASVSFFLKCGFRQYKNTDTEKGKIVLVRSLGSAMKS